MAQYINRICPECKGRHLGDDNRLCKKCDGEGVILTRTDIPKDPGKVPERLVLDVLEGSTAVPYQERINSHKSAKQIVRDLRQELATVIVDAPSPEESLGNHVYYMEALQPIKDRSRRLLTAMALLEGGADPWGVTLALAAIEKAERVPA